MNDYTTNYPTCGTTESNTSLVIKKNFLSEKTSKITKVIIYFLSIILTFITASLITSMLWVNHTEKAYGKGFDKGYDLGCKVTKIEATNSEQTIDISKAYNYDGNKK